MKSTMNTISIRPCKGAFSGVLESVAVKSYTADKTPDPYLLFAPLACPPHFLAASSTLSVGVSFAAKIKDSQMAFVDIMANSVFVSCSTGKEKSGINPFVMNVRAANHQFQEFYQLFQVSIFWLPPSGNFR